MSDRVYSHMNCNCLKSIIKADEDNHNYDTEQFGTRVIKSVVTSWITFQTFVRFRVKVTNNFNECTKDRLEEDYKSIPIFFCPICGEKSKQEIPKDSFYYKLNKQD